MIKTGFGLFGSVGPVILVLGVMVFSSTALFLVNPSLLERFFDAEMVKWNQTLSDEFRQAALEQNHTQRIQDEDGKWIELYDHSNK